MSTLAVSYTFSPTTTIESGQVNQNFSDIVNFVNNTASPVGLVAMWKGSIASIPTGWTIDTDLRDKFALGAGNLYAYGDVGGEVEHTLTEAELPVIDMDSKMTDPGHYVSQLAKSSAGSGDGIATASNGGSRGNWGSQNPQYTGITFSNIGSGDSHNNMPPFYALAYIRRT